MGKGMGAKRRGGDRDIEWSKEKRWKTGMRKEGSKRIRGGGC